MACEMIGVVHPCSIQWKHFARPSLLTSVRRIAIRFAPLDCELATKALDAVLLDSGILVIFSESMRSPTGKFPECS